MVGAGTYVPSEGPVDARIVILGESPWVNEVSAGHPFAGMSGNLLRKWHVPLGLDREKMRLMNLYPWRPPAREIASVPTEGIVKAIAGVHDRIAQLEDPFVIVPMGNYATFALTGKGKVRADVRNEFIGFDTKITEAEKKAGITQLRGGIYPYRDLNGRVIKVIPTIHPAAVMQMQKWEKRSIADWARIKRESAFREIRRVNRRHIVRPSQDEIAAFYAQVVNGGSDVRLAIDIETWGKTISCVGFAMTAAESITLPTAGKDKDNLAWVRGICESAAQKVLCNGLYDWYWLNSVGIRLNNFIWDVQLMHHALDPVENHSLDFLASIYIDDYTYWKDEAKEAEEIVKYARDLDALYVYNGLDCCYTRELVDVLEFKLRYDNLLDFYHRHYGAMIEPLLLTMRHGIRVDVEKQKKAAKQLRAELKEIHAALNEIAGEELFACEKKTALREPTVDEWVALCGRKVECDLFGEKVIPKAKEIDRDARNAMKERGLTYMMSGKNAGMVRYEVMKVKKDFSNVKLMKLFYEKLKLPKQFALRKGKKGKSKSVSLADAALRTLMFKFEKAREPGRLLLEYREKKKELDYLRGSYDKDGRMRCSYKMLTNAGRLSSAKNPMRTGYNLQNLKR